MKDKLKREIQVFLKTVSEENIERSYQLLVEILLPYKTGVSKEEIFTIFTEICREMSLDTYQDEVLWDISYRLEGLCSPGREINWQEKEQ